MPETMEKTANLDMVVRYRGRGAQVWIYFGKFLRMFFYQNDWKVLPMAALIAGLVGMVMKWSLFQTMEGTLMGAFALVMVCIWNGCFNSIQVICRERDVIKREHRSGMHISSYIVAHMMYQAILCLLQTGITLYVTRMIGLRYDLCHAVFSRWFMCEFGFSMFLITFAADMMALWISTLARSTTTAMTIMPFVLIFQLVFSGGMLSLPGWTRYITPLTISNPALKVVATQGDYNERPVMTIWNQLDKLRDKELSATLNVSDVIDLLMDKSIPAIKRLHETQLTRVFTLGEVRDLLNSEGFQAFKKEHVLEETSVADILRYINEMDEFQALRSFDFKLHIPGLNLGKALDILMSNQEIMDFLSGLKVIQTTTVGDVLDAINADGLLEKYKDVQLGKDIFVGDVLDMIINSETVQSYKTQSYTYTTTVGAIVDMVGEDFVKDVLQNRIAEASYNKAYAHTQKNVMKYWGNLLMFVLGFAVLSIITLEFIDKDKR